MTIVDDQFVRETYAQLSLRDRTAVRWWTRRFTVLAPNRYEPWLILGLFSRQLVSIYFIKRALQTNPNSRWARAGLRWATKRFQENPKVKSAPVPKEQSAFPPPSGRKGQFQTGGGYGFLLPAFILLAGCVALGAVWRVRAAEKPIGTISAITPTPFLPVSPTPRPTETSTSIPTFEPTPTVTLLPLPSVTAPSAAIAPSGSISSSDGKNIVVSLSQQRLFAYQGDTLVYDFVVSTGRNGATALGNFEILDKLSDAYSALWDFWMPDWMGFYYPVPDMEDGFHALPILPDGETIWGDDLGMPVSYGCIVLGSEDAQLLFQWADIGTPVNILE